MMNSKFTQLNGAEAKFDLDKVIEILRGYSKEKPGWTCIIVLDPLSKKFIEIRNSPPNYHGDCEDEAVELAEADVTSYGLSPEQIIGVKRTQSYGV